MACELALLFEQAKRVSRERASKRRIREWQNGEERGEQLTFLAESQPHRLSRGGEGLIPYKNDEEGWSQFRSSRREVNIFTLEGII